MMRAIQRRQRLIADMKKALQDEGFTFFLQPKYNSVTGKIVSMEALARWEHSEFGSVPPSEFVPLMEKSGLVTWLDRFVWEGVCRVLREWQMEGRRVVPISVNVSRQDFEIIDVPESFNRLVKRYDIDPRLLRVEITETIFAENMDQINRAVEQLHQYGFTVLMDDFGSGYSSLNMLKDTNVDVLKLDMKFIEMNEENREKGIQIISSIVDMAHKLHMIIVAEGVESREQVDMLRSMNCIYGQGFYFCKPMTVQEIHSMLDRMDADDYACTDLRRRNAEEGVFLRDFKTERDALAIFPEQFKQMEANANGRFYVALREYQRKVVREDWHAEFERLFDYDEVRQCIEEKGMLHMTYQKTDDSWVQLHVMKYTEDGSDVKNANLLIWIFANPCRK